MTARHSGPLSRPFGLNQLPAGDVVVTASAAEREALAADLGLVAIDRLESTLRVTKGADRLRVAGRLRAAIRQACVVTLDEFASEIEAPIELEFADGGSGSPDTDVDEAETDLDAPDELVGGRIDFGTVTAEFLALAIDPYPRKPGVAFAPDVPEETVASPFAALTGLARDRGTKT